MPVSGVRGWWRCAPVTNLLQRSRPSSVIFAECSLARWHTKASLWQQSIRPEFPSVSCRALQLQLPKKNKQTMLTLEEFYPLTSTHCSSFDEPLESASWARSLFWCIGNHKNTTQYLSFSLTSQSCRLTSLARLFSWFLILFLQGINTYLKCPKWDLTLPNDTSASYVVSVCFYAKNNCLRFVSMTAVWTWVMFGTSCEIAARPRRTITTVAEVWPYLWVCS